MKQKIKDKLKELQAQKEQVMAQLNAIMGAEQVLNDLLKKEVKKDGN